MAGQIQYFLSSIPIYFVIDFSILQFTYGWVNTLLSCEIPGLISLPYWILIMIFAIWKQKLNYEENLVLNWKKHQWPTNDAATFLCSRQFPTSSGHTKVIVAYQSGGYSCTITEVLGALLKGDPDLAEKDNQWTDEIACRLLECCCKIQRFTHFSSCNSYWYECLNIDLILIPLMEIIHKN